MASRSFDCVHKCLPHGSATHIGLRSHTKHRMSGVKLPWLFCSAGAGRCLLRTGISRRDGRQQHEMPRMHGSWPDRLDACVCTSFTYLICSGTVCLSLLRHLCCVFRHPRSLLLEGSCCRCWVGVSHTLHFLLCDHGGGESGPQFLHRSCRDCTVADS